MNFNYEEYKAEQIKGLGFDAALLTESQKDILLEPSEAPENYMCDGEINATQARARWSRRMKEAGFKEIDIMNVKSKLGL